MPIGKCPKCEKTPQHVNFEVISIKQTFNVLGGGFNGLSYLCPLCNTILSTQIDPIALKADIVKEVCDAFGVKAKRR